MYTVQNKAVVFTKMKASDICQPQPDYVHVTIKMPIIYEYSLGLSYINMVKLHFSHTYLLRTWIITCTCCNLIKGKIS